MNLFRETGAFVSWMGRLGRLFFRLRPVTSTVVVIASTINRVTAILAFLLPLKVILLVASDGVSRWFQPFVGPDGKDSLVLVLTVAAIASFFLSIILDAVTDRLAASTGASVLRGSNELAVVGNQDAEAQTVYAQFSDVVSGTLFTLAGLGVIGLVNPLLLGVLAGIFLAQFALTSMVLGTTDAVNPGIIGRLVRNDLRDYLNILSSVDFLVAFGVLLYPFVWGGGGDVLAALVSIIVLRRVLGVMTGVVRDSVKMTRRRAVINALVFPEHQYRGKERDLMQTLRAIFSKAERQVRVRELLKGAGIGTDDVEVLWQDCRLPGVSQLSVKIPDTEEGIRFYQQQIYMPKQDHRLENEAVLFDYVSRAQVHGPELLLRFPEGPFQCQICEAGRNRTVSDDNWRAVRHGLIERLLCIQPPRELVRAFTMSRPLLHDRLTDDLIGRLEVGVDTEEERKSLDAFWEILPTVRDRLQALPLYIQNPEIRQSNVLLDGDDNPLVMTWGKWALEPVGAALPGGINADAIEDLERSMRRARSDIPREFGKEHMELAGSAHELEQLIHGNLLKGALHCVERLLSNPVLVTELDVNRALGDAGNVGGRVVG